MKFVLTLFFFAWARAQHPGHGKPLGFHRPSSGHIDVYEEGTMPSPLEFWTKYASKGEPVLFRGAANRSLARHRWTDEYVREHFGDLEVKMEGKVEKGGDLPVSELGAGRMAIREFLNRYETDNVYVVSQLPEPMYGDVSVLPCLTCGAFRRRLLEVDLWFSSGGTKSLLHRDADNAINCLLAGRKDWILIDRKYTHLVPLATEPDGAFGAFALLDVDRVNLKKYPQLVGLPWRHANVTAGDCLYLPYSYLHQVRSYERNIAVSVLFARLEEFDEGGCKRHGDDDYVPLDQLHVTWSYSGHGQMSMGNADPEHVRLALRTFLDENGVLSRDALHRGLVENKELTDDEAEDAVDEMFSLFGRDGGIVIDQEVIAGLNEADLKLIANLTTMDDQDEANTYEYEHVLFERESVKLFVEDMLSSPDDKVTSEAFVDKWVNDFGGSATMGFKLFSAIDLAAKGYITSYDLSEAGEKPYEAFRPKKVDKGNVEYHEEMKEVETVFGEKTNDVDTSAAVHEEL